MQEKLTILISSERKKFIKRHARRHNKSISKYIDDLLGSIQRESSQDEANDEWVKKTAGAYKTGKKDVIADLFKGITR